MSNDPETGDDGGLRIRIRTLTSLLHGLGVRRSPSRTSNDILPFLYCFTMLLMLDGQRDGDTRKHIRVAVTGSINASNQVRVLVVSQSPNLKNDSMCFVEKRKRPLEEVVKGPEDVPLLDHIADVWAALTAFDRTATNHARFAQSEALELFFLSRSFENFVTRFQHGVALCGGKQLYEIINDWKPGHTSTKITSKWVNTPEWLLRTPGMPLIESRTVQGQVQSHFSDNTKQAWSQVLAVLLFKVDKGIKQVKRARDLGKNAEAEGCPSQAMRDLNKWCRILWHLILWDAGIVKTLLTKTTIVDSISTQQFPITAVNQSGNGDNGAEFLMEPGESKGQQIYRYLKALIAWRPGLYYLSNDATLPMILENVEIGLLELSPLPCSILTQQEISAAFLVRFPSMIGRQKDVVDALTACHPGTFRGCLHPEAMLMGLINYHMHQTVLRNCDLEQIEQYMQVILQSVADSGRAVINVNDKCCWCCNWLRRHLGKQFRLPGSHGIMYPWDPPMVGISQSVLEDLEEVLWSKLYRAVSSAVS